MKKKVVLSISLWVLAIVFTILVKVFDQAPIGPNGSVVGFSHVNQIFAQVIGENQVFYKITEVLGILALGLVLGYALLGLGQLIKRKKIAKVDKEIIILGIFYILVLGIYIFFEKCIINYRPILIDGILEASYPSSHTMLSIFVCGSAIILNKKLFKDKKWLKVVNEFNYLLLFSVLGGRILSGAHWITDILGGVLFAGALLVSYKGLIEK